MIAGRLLRRFTTSSRSALARYNQKLQDNIAVWESMFPKKYSPELQFYSKDQLQVEPIDFSLHIVWDLLRRKGKKIRPAFMLMLADMYGLDHKLALPLCFLVETIHNATLIIDDIEDSSLQRRGEPCVHLKYGMDNAINAGNLAYFLPVFRLLEQPAFQALSASTQLSLMRIFVEEMKNIHLGLATDIYWHGERLTLESLPTENHYYRMVESKTSVLLRIGFRMVGTVAGLESTEIEKLSRFANLIGTSFQIQDDLINLESPEYSKSKGTPIGEDITEGKITLMVIHYLRQTKDPWMLKTLQSHTKDEAVILDVIDKMRKAGSLEFAHKVQRDFMKDSERILESLKSTKASEAKNDLKEVMQELLDRKV